MPPQVAFRNPVPSRLPSPEKLRAVLSRQGLTIACLTNAVGNSTVYQAFALPHSRLRMEALCRICAFLRCPLDDLSNPS